MPPPILKITDLPLEVPSLILRDVSHEHRTPYPFLPDMGIRLFPSDMLESSSLQEVSSKFRDAYNHSVTAVDLQDWRSLDLAQVCWKPLQRFKRMNRIFVSGRTLPMKSNILSLYFSLYNSGIRLRSGIFSLCGYLSMEEVYYFACFFNKHVTELIIGRSDTLDPGARDLHYPPEDEENNYIDMNLLNLLQSVEGQQIFNNLDQYFPTTLSEWRLERLYLSKTILLVPNLLCLELVWERSFTNEFIATIAEHTARLQCLVTRRLDGITDDQMSKWLGPLHYLQVLFLQHSHENEECGVGDLSMQALCNRFTQSSLHTLKLRALTSLTNDGLRRVIRDCKYLSTVSVKYCENVSRTNLDLFTRHNALESFHFRNNRNTNFELDQLSAPDLEIRQFHLGYCNQLSSESIACISALPKLRDLSLRELSVVSEDVFDELSKLKLDNLALEGNLGLTETAISLLFGRNGGTIQSLRLKDMLEHISDNSLRPLVEFCPNLKSLRICGAISIEGKDFLRSHIEDVKVFPIQG